MEEDKDRFVVFAEDIVIVDELEELPHEVIIEAGPEISLDHVCELMGRTPPWIPGLLLRADGYECEFYKKD